MNVTYHCSACQQTVREPVSAESSSLNCPHCQQQISIPENAIKGSRLQRCLVCPSVDLFARKDFPQRLGVGLVVFAVIAAILFATALIDLVLYIVMGESLTCYRCGAQYRGCEEIELHGGFDLETHERYRQLAARIKTTSHVQTANPAE
jgi:hypothetical protein